MPAEIFGERFFGRRTPAWHRIGTVMDADLTVSEAMKHCDVGFEIFTSPSYIRLPDGTEVQTNHNAIVREPVVDDNEYRVLSVVGGEWTPIQMRDLATYLDPISEKYPVETMGALDRGKKIFFTLDAGTSAIAGEEHKLYYLVTDHRDGLGALTIAFTPVRVVCQNTLTTGLNSAKVSTRLTHDRMIKVNTQWYTNIFNSMLTAQDTVVAQMNRLADFDLDTGEAERVLAVAYPPTPQPKRLRLSNGISQDDVPKETWMRILNDTKADRDAWEKSRDNDDKIRGKAWERFEAFNDEFPKVANTPWAIWQAIVETEDYRKGQAKTASPIFGERANRKARAFKAALALCS